MDFILLIQFIGFLTNIALLSRKFVIFIGQGEFHSRSTVPLESHSVLKSILKAMGVLIKAHGCTNKMSFLKWAYLDHPYNQKF